MDEVLFSCSTSDGYALKQLSDLLQTNLQQLMILLTRSGIYLVQEDAQSTVLYDVYLNSNNFDEYVYNFDDSTGKYIGINARIMYMSMKILKKKDTLVLTIYRNKPDLMSIKILPKHTSNHIESFTLVTQTQSILIYKPDGYDNTVDVLASNFYQIIKEFNTMTKQITITVYNGSIKLNCQQSSLLSRQIIFGNQETDGQVLFTNCVETSKFMKNVKIAKLDKIIRVCVKHEDGIMMLRSKIGDIGEISIYIKLY